MRNKAKKVLSVFLRVALSAGLLIFLCRQINIEKTKEVLLSADINFIVYAFLVYIIIFGVLLFRWSAFIKAMGMNVPFLTVARFHFLGLFFNPFLPTGVGGDIIKVIGLCSHTSEKPKVLASVVLDRLVGFMGMVLVASVAFVAGFRLINDPALGSSVGVLALMSFLMTSILFNGKIYSFFCRVFKSFPKLEKKLMEMHYAIAMLKDRRGSIYLTIAYSCIAQVTLSVTYYLLARALHQDVPLVYFLIFTPLICVASSLPSIGGLGVREAGTVFLFAKAGVAAGLSVSISLITYLFSVFVGLAGVVFFTASRSPSEEKLSEIEEELKTELLD